MRANLFPTNKVLRIQYDDDDELKEIADALATIVNIDKRGYTG